MEESWYSAGLMLKCSKRVLHIPTLPNITKHGMMFAPPSKICLRVPYDKILEQAANSTVVVSSYPEALAPAVPKAWSL